MEERWIEIRKGGDFQRTSDIFNISPILARLIRNRDIVELKNIDKYLNGTLRDLHDGIQLKDMRKAADIIAMKIEGHQYIRIIGDYDIDGVSATYILMKALQGLGARVDSDIPDRIKDGYGLNIDLIERAIADGVDTIITCDNGIAARSEIAYAKENGLTVIITDHHEVPYEEVDTVGVCKEEESINRRYILPDADAIIDPKQVDCTYPFKGLCGAAVAYKFMEVLYQVMGYDVEDITFLIEIVAIATVGDVMDLVDENRIFVKHGLEMLKNTRNFGLRALMEKTMNNIEELSSYHIGFVIGPCLNAGGRLDTAKKALNLMLAKSEKEASILAEELIALNEERKQMTLQGVELAKQMVEKELKEDRVLVVYLPACHESLAGIIAGRLREMYHKPTFVITKAEEGIKGSGRSIDAYHMYEELNKCQELLIKYGGHKLAAGFSLKEENLLSLRTKLNQVSTLTAEELLPRISLDMQLPIGYVNEAFIEELEKLEPFGKGNTKPHFVERNLEATRLNIFGKNQNVVKMNLRDAGGREITGMRFGDVESLVTYITDKFGSEALARIKRGVPAGVILTCVYYPTVNTYNGKTTLQIVIQNYR